MSMEAQTQKSGRADRGYFGAIITSAKSIFEGMAVTFSYLFKEPTTVQYPDRIPVPLTDTLPERYRGFLEVDMSVCTGCLQCSRDCPIDWAVSATMVAALEVES